MARLPDLTGFNRVPWSRNSCDFGHRPALTGVPRIATTRKLWERQMSYISNVANQRPMLRVAAGVFLAFFCAAPLVLLFSSLVAYGVQSFLR
jgi:hypothetical protein